MMLDPNRQTGRTVNMLRRAVAMADLGFNVVYVAESHWQIKYLADKVRLICDMPIIYNLSRSRILLRYGSIRFCTEVGFGVRDPIFIDHYAEERGNDTRNRSDLAVAEPGDT